MSILSSDEVACGTCSPGWGLGDSLGSAHSITISCVMCIHPVDKKTQDKDSLIHVIYGLMLGREESVSGGGELSAL